MVDFSTKQKIKKALRALNESRPIQQKTLNARIQANQAKTILHSHRNRNPAHHARVVVKQD